MKKVFTILTGIAVAGLVSCGPSAEEQKAMEDAAKKTADSIANELLNQASTPPAEPASADTTPATNPAHGEEGHVCDANCTGMK